MNIQESHIDLSVLINFILSNYNFLNNNYSYDDINHLLRYFNENSVLIINNNEPVAFGIFLLLSDQSFKLVQDKSIDITLSSTLMKLINEDGDNIHFILAVSKSYHYTREALKEVIKKFNPKTISWFSPDMLKLNIYDAYRLGKIYDIDSHILHGGTICHQSS